MPEYTDDSEVEIVCSEPDSDPDIDPEDAFVEDLTEEELQTSEFLTQVIDVDDHEDNGDQWRGFTSELLQALMEEGQS